MPSPQALRDGRSNAVVKPVPRMLLLFLTLSMACTLVVAGRDKNGLQLVLETDKSAYAPYEPILLNYWVENTSRTALAVPTLIDAHFGWIRFEIASGGGPFKPYRTGEMADGGWSTAPLEPGKRLLSKVVVVTNLYGRAARMNRQYAGTRLFPFSEPGTYRIRGTYPITIDGDSALASNVVTVSIRGASKEEQEAFAFFTDPDEYAAAVGADAEAKNQEAGIRRWEEFVERYPKSIYTPAIRMHLGRLYLNGTGVAREPELAAAHFRAVADTRANGQTDDALIELAKSEIERGRVVDAEAALTELMKRFPNSARKSDALRLRDGLAKGWRTLHDIYSN